MELQCPQCGKWMAVSREELLLHDSQVVCPQCLAVCLYENDTLVVRDDSDAPYRHTAVVAEAPHTTSRYCHSCGKQLPSGIRFCPYCGADLEAPFDKTEPFETPRQSVPQPQVEEKHEEVKPERPSKPRTRERQPAEQMEEKLRTITHSYSGRGMHLQQQGSMPSTAFKVVAYAIILLLLALLVYIIMAGASIEPAP